MQCPKEGCNGEEAAFFQVQIRSADEPMTGFYKVRTSHGWEGIVETMLTGIVYGLWESVARKLRAWEVGLEAMGLREEIVFYLMAVQRGVPNGKRDLLYLNKFNAAICSPIPFLPNFSIRISKLLQHRHFLSRQSQRLSLGISSSIHPL
jgi:hypothetical protein